MAEPGRIQMCLFLSLVLQITAADEHKTSYVFVRVGHEVTLPCPVANGDQGKCSNIIWNLSVSRKNKAVEQFGAERVGEKANSESDGLSVTGNCSLVIKKVKLEDVGLYGCKELILHQVALFDLFVVTITEHKDDNKVTLNCSVWTHKQCKLTVKWLYEGKHVDENNKDLNTSQFSCYKTVSFMESHSIYTSRKNELLHCEIIHTFSGKEQQFPFRSQFLDDITQRSFSSLGVQMMSWGGGLEKQVDHDHNLDTTGTTESPIKSATAAGELSDASTNLPVWWWLIVVAVGLAGLIISAAVVQRHKKIRGETHNITYICSSVASQSFLSFVFSGRKTQMSGNSLSLNPAEPQSGPETGQDTTDPEDGVSYASISFTKKTNSKVQVQNQGEEDDDDEGYAVTYSSVNPRSI
ncbi:uncharacterized protein [Channa argus]|uniref:uncharacterized protein isoform X2 n=1 Tax=Channa argus TaxID=215402 RepID=UPI003521F494